MSAPALNGTEAKGSELDHLTFQGPVQIPRLSPVTQRGGSERLLLQLVLLTVEGLTALENNRKLIKDSELE